MKKLFLLIPSVAGMTGRSQMIYIPANVPGSQMGFQNLSYTSSILDGIINMYNKQIYIPCSTSAGCGPFGSTAETVLKFNLGWWEKDRSFFYYPAMLISAFYGMRYPNFRGQFKIPRKEFTLWGDSGGFQIANQGVEIDPAKLAEWYNENIDVGFMLDTPIVSKGVEMSISGFERALEKSYRDSEKLLKYCDIPIYGVLHGHTLEDMEKWWNKISDLGFTSWAGGAKPPDDTMLQALIVLKLKEYGVKRVHILGVSGFSTVAVLAYLSKHFDLLTYDSGSYGVGAMFRKYYLPYTINKSISFGREEKMRLSSLPCNCEVCRYIEDVSELYEDGSIPGALISLHNLLYYLNYNKFVISIVENEEYFKDFVRKNFSEYTFKTLEFIDFSLEKGLDIAYNAFKPKFRKRKFETMMRRLDDFV